MTTKMILVLDSSRASGEEATAAAAAQQQCNQPGRAKLEILPSNFFSFVQ
jgi:hypothetical protein